MAKTRTILVTGASGHLGPTLVQALVERGDNVRALVRNGNVDVKGVNVLRGDILDKEFVRRAVQGVDLVYHLAAVVDYPGVSEPQMRQVNIEGTRNMLNVFKGRLVYQSTTSVYGYSMKENPATPTTQYNPYSEYGRTKVEAERLVLGSGGIVLRAPVIFGGGFNTPFIDLLGRLQKGSMPIIGSGNNHIQWICVDDLVNALLLAGDKGKEGQIYLVAAKQPTTQEELLTLLAGTINAPAPHKHIPKPIMTLVARMDEFKAKRSGKKPKVTVSAVQRMGSDRMFDISKAEKELGFTPKVDFQVWARDLAKEYLAQKQN